jgi:hypothetical protein
MGDLLWIACVARAGCSAFEGGYGKTYVQLGKGKACSKSRIQG